MNPANNGQTKIPMVQKVGLGCLIAASALGLSGAKVSWPQTAQAEVWQTQKAPPAGATTAAAVATVDIQKLNQAFTSLAERMSPTVVNIYTRSGVPMARRPFRGMPEDDFNYFFENPFGQRPGMRRAPEAQALGSGFVINDKEGYIMTNAHVVRMAGRDADEIMVKFINESDSSKGHKAKIVGVDEATDVALLKLVERKDGLKAAPLGNSDASKVGEWVVAIGNPYGHTHTLTQGIVSAVGRSLEGLRADFIQTSASINPGNSGGPLINMNGEVIGINTAIDPRGQGIGFAIPINTAKTVVNQIVESGRVQRAWMGIGIQDVNEEVAGLMKLEEPVGVLVRQVVANQPAARAGIEPYDVIRKINGQEIKSTRDLLRAVDKLEIGKAAEVEVIRNNEVKNLKVQLREQPSTQTS